MAKGFTQREGIDYTKIFSPVVKHTSIRMLLSLVIERGLELEQLDVKTAFLHGHLDETIYMKQPEGYTQKGNEEMVCLLKKSLYGLKQSPRCWYRRFDDFITRNWFERSAYDSCFYVKATSKIDEMYLLLYVDDMLLAGKRKEDKDQVKACLNT